MRAAHLQRPEGHHRRRASGPGDRRADRRGRPRRAGVRVRLGPLVLPRRVRRTRSARSDTSSSASSRTSARDVTGVAPGDLVVAPFIYSDMSCPHCRNGSTISCAAGGSFGNGTIDGGQGEAVRVPLAGSTLVPVPGYRSLRRDAAVAAHAHRRDVDRTSRGRVRRGEAGRHGRGRRRRRRRAVRGARLESARRRADHRPQPPSRAADTRRASSAPPTSSRSRGDEANDAVLELTGGIGVDAALECVGTQQSIDTAAAIARPGSTIGIVGVPHGEVPFNETFFRNVGWRGGPAPARIYIPELLDDVLEGRINPGLVLDYETDLDHVVDAYAAMDERRAIKSLIRVGA